MYGFHSDPVHEIERHRSRAELRATDARRGQWAAALRRRRDVMASSFRAYSAADRTRRRGGRGLDTAARTDRGAPALRALITPPRGERRPARPTRATANPNTTPSKEEAPCAI